MIKKACENIRRKTTKQNYFGHPGNCVQIYFESKKLFQLEAKILGLMKAKEDLAICLFIRVQLIFYFLEECFT